MIEQDGYHHVIAPLTLKGAQSVIDIDSEVNIYFPTINKKDIASDSIYLTFGAIDID